MLFRGYIKGGKVVVEDRIDLPDGTAVDVQPAGGNGAPRKQRSKRAKSKSASPTGATLYERLKGVIGKAKGLPRDFAARHDHYIHGAPRR
jgi:hypothetical protein